MAGWHAGALAVIAKDAAQPRRGEGLAPMRALRHDEQRLRSRLGALGEEIGLDEAGDLRIEWDGAFLVALADDAHPATPDVHVGHLEAEHLGRAQAGEQHEPGDGAVPLAAKAREQRCGLGPVEPAWQPARLSQRQLRAHLRSPKVGEQPTALADGAAASSRAPRDRVPRARITHLEKAEQPRDRREAAVDRARRKPEGAAARQRDHVVVLAAASRRAACREVAQQGVGVDRLEAQPFCVQPPGEVQEVEGIGVHAGGRVVPVGEIGEVVVAQLEVRRRTVPYESPAPAASGHSQRSFHGTSVTQHEPVERKRESLWILRIHCPQNPHDPQATTTTDGSLAG